MAKGKLHPLWYSEFLPINFLCSSVFAGLSMLIVRDHQPSGVRLPDRLQASTRLR